MTDVNYNLYELNKINMAKLPILTYEEENSAKSIIRTFLRGLTNTNYFMMLCHDNHDFTLFDIKGKDLITLIDIIATDIIDCMHNRGFRFIDIAQVEGGLEIWVKEPDQNEVSYLYMFFPYDNGVITY